mmetsp:Transcript_29018/g.69990  ORF Transcript_29018/g.69990 Transcript_29018/m.69990 type:complete len:99 (-) Transcript_29018:42-338(-)
MLVSRRVVRGGRLWDRRSVEGGIGGGGDREGSGGGSRGRSDVVLLGAYGDCCEGDDDEKKKLLPTSPSSTGRGSSCHCLPKNTHFNLKTLLLIDEEEK